MALERNAAIASNRRRRWPIGTIPISLRSSAVSLGKTSASTAFSRNAASYCSRPSSRSHAPTSTAVSSRLVMLAAGYCGGTASVQAKKYLLTHFPQPPKHDTNHEHIVLAGPGDGSEQGAISKRSQ